MSCQPPHQISARSDGEQVRIVQKCNSAKLSEKTCRKPSDVPFLFFSLLFTLSLSLFLLVFPYNPLILMSQKHLMGLVQRLGLFPHRREAQITQHSPPPDYVLKFSKPAIEQQVSNFAFERTFVSMSEPLSSVCIFSSTSNFDSTTSRIQ